MSYPIGATAEVGGPDGYSYGAALVRTADLPRVLEILGGIGFSGWIAPPASGWTVVLGDPGGGVVAASRRGIIEVGAILAGQLQAVVFVARVLLDRQLVIVGWQGDEEVGRYSSDPSKEPKADEEVLDEPVGAFAAYPFATIADREEVGEELAELLEEELDSDSVYESERLRQVLRLLGLPDWIVAAAALPKNVPTGPPTAELVRLRAGRSAFAGWVRNIAVRRYRRRRTPPPAIADPPGRSPGMDGLEPWMF